MMMTQQFETRLEAYYRLLLLSFLNDRPGRQANSHLVQLWFAHIHASIGMDKLRTVAHWLHEQQLITLTPLGDYLDGYALTRRGREVVEGRCVMPGVARVIPE